MRKITLTLLVTSLILMGCLGLIGCAEKSIIWDPFKMDVNLDKKGQEIKVSCLLWKNNRIIDSVYSWYPFNMQTHGFDSVENFGLDDDEKIGEFLDKIEILFRKTISELEPESEMKYNKLKKKYEKERILK